MASTDATAYPIKNAAWRVTFPILDADGDLVTGATGLDSEVSKDGGTFADCTNEATEIATNSGVYYLDLTSTEMNADTVAIIVKTSSSGAKTTTIVAYPDDGTRNRVDVRRWTGAAVATPDTAGYPKVTVKAGTGTGEVSLASGAVTVGTNNDKTGYRLSATGVDDVWDEARSGHVAAGSFGEGVASVQGNVTGSVGSVSGAVGSVTGNVGGNVTGSVGSLATQAKADVNAEVDAALVDIHLDHLLAATYDPASKPGAADALLNEMVENDGGVSRFTANALEQAPTGGSAPSAADIRAEIDSNSTQLAAIVADTNELQTDWANGGRLDLILDARASQTSVDDLPTNSELSTALAAADDAVLAAIAALNNLSSAQAASAVLTTQMTESYNADGTAPTLAQAVFLILQMLTEKSVSSTTLTVKKLDGSTTAATFTLNDATEPTSITRAS